MFQVLIPILTDVTLFRNRIFADDQVKMRSLEWALIQYECVLILCGEIWTQRSMHTQGEHPVEMKAETEVVHLQAQ